MEWSSLRSTCHSARPGDGAHPRCSAVIQSHDQRLGDSQLLTLQYKPWQPLLLFYYIFQQPRAGLDTLPFKIKPGCLVGCHWGAWKTLQESHELQREGALVRNWVSTQNHPFGTFHPQVAQKAKQKPTLPFLNSCAPF